MSVRDNVISLWKERRPDIKSVAELERKANLSNGIIKQWESSTPSMKSAQKIATFFNVPITQILTEKTSEQKNTDDTSEQVKGLFRKVSDEYELNSNEKKELQEDFSDYLELRAKRLRERRQNRDN